MEENTNQDPMEKTISPVEIERDIDSVIKKPTKEIFTVKFWLVLLTIVFTISMASGLYLSFGGRPLSGQKTVKLDVEGEAKEGVSSLLKLSSKDSGVAVIKVRGVIQEGSEGGFSAKQSASAVAKRIRTLADKKEVKGLLLDINSPGGTVASVQDIYEAILYFKSQKKPVVALFRDVAASGGFYIAMAADKIVAQPGTITGSIGVIMQTTNVEGLFDKIGVKMVPIKSGQYKDMGSAYRPLTEAEIALLQDMIDDTYKQFFNVVKTGRPNVTDANLKIYADGRVFTGSQAMGYGLIDGLGGEEKAKEYLSDLTGIKKIKLLTPKIDGFFDFLSMSAGGVEGKLGLNKLEEMASPKVSYLWTY